MVSDIWATDGEYDRCVIKKRKFMYALAYLGGAILIVATCDRF